MLNNASARRPWVVHSRGLFLAFAPAPVSPSVMPGVVVGDAGSGVALEGPPPALEGPPPAMSKVESDRSGEGEDEEGHPPGSNCNTAWPARNTM